MKTRYLFWEHKIAKDRGMKGTKDAFIHETKVAVTSLYHCRVWLMSNTLHHDSVCLKHQQVIIYWNIDIETRYFFSYWVIRYERGNNY